MCFRRANKPSDTRKSKGSWVIPAYLQPSDHLSTSSSPSVPTQPFRFLDLPAEIRIKIYNLVFGLDDGRVYHIKSCKKPRGITCTLYIEDERSTSNRRHSQNEAMQSSSGRNSPISILTLDSCEWDPAKTIHPDLLLPGQKFVRATGDIPIRKTQNLQPARARGTSCTKALQYLSLKPSSSRNTKVPASAPAALNSLHFQSRARNFRSSVGAALLLTNRKIYSEAAHYFYSSAEFYFHSPNSLDRFLSGLSSLAQINITSLWLAHITSGEPWLAKNRQWKLRHDARWEGICSKAAAQLVNLRDLRVVLKVCDWPLKMGLKEHWVHPLLLFAQCEWLEHVNVRIHVPVLGNQERKAEMVKSRGQLEMAVERYLQRCGKGRRMVGEDLKLGLL
ncbi:hypothetical protein L228DRAFT_258226 [Xylona heveae TC161]|uniref:DUF7730 domain-containing protein n=1 Tax=Xylona heveae (strain CBS 132557 / TC161) TaxID=1328760 RepID=A0A165K0X7_XYLHT|nr:hypothetical protein L228DRAFT_258226 [Xylona heveae TC161]KZF26866.1 hypothetical protein L228DRAFT_258226 [Xylona heveae TC161]